MGAYTNPTAVVDTSNVWADAINRLSNIDQKRQQAERDETLKYNKEFADNMKRITNAGIDDMSTIKRNAIQNKVLHTQEMGELKEIMNYKTHLQKQALTATGSELTKLNGEIDGLDTRLMSYVTFKKTNLDATNTFMTEDLDGNITNVGRQGYLSINLDNKYSTAKLIDSGYLNGTKKAVYDDEQGWGYEYNTGGQESKKGGKDLIEGEDKTFRVYNDVDKKFNPTIIPEIDKFYTNILVEAGVMDKNGKIMQNFLDFDKSLVRHNNKGIAEQYYPADMLKIADKVNAIMNTQLGIAGGGGAYTDREKISIWKDIFNKKEFLKFDDNGGQMNKDDRLLFEKEFKERLGKFIPRFGVNVGKENIITFNNSVGNKTFGTGTKPGTETSTDDYTLNKVNSIYNGINKIMAGGVGKRVTDDKRLNTVEDINQAVTVLDEQLGNKATVTSRDRAIRSQEAAYNELLASDSATEKDQLTAKGVLEDIKKSDQKSVWVSTNGGNYKKANNYDPFSTISNLEMLISYGGLSQKQRTLVQSQITNIRKLQHWSKPN